MPSILPGVSETYTLCFRLLTDAFFEVSKGFSDYLFRLLLKSFRLLVYSDVCFRLELRLFLFQTPCSDDPKEHPRYEEPARDPQRQGEHLRLHAGGGHSHTDPRSGRTSRNMAGTNTGKQINMQAGQTEGQAGRVI